MKITLLQLNINSDNYWKQLTKFLLSHDFDVLHLQEITGKDTISGIISSKRDIFIELQKVLGDKYHGTLSLAQRFSSNPDSYMGNATFYRKEFTLIAKKELVLASHDEPYPSDATSWENEGRKVLHLQLEIEKKKISFINVHFAWAKTPKEQPHQTEQGEILLTYLQTVSHPFILSGDFNLAPNQPVIQHITKIARNLTSEYNVTNTLNPRLHRAKQLFPPGVAVDYLFTSPDIQVTNFSVIKDDISDHFGLIAEMEV